MRNDAACRPRILRERVAQQRAARKVFGAAPCMHRGYHALPILGRHERRDGGAFERAPVGVVELDGAGAAVTTRGEKSARY